MILKRVDIALFRKYADTCFTEGDGADMETIRRRNAAEERVVRAELGKLNFSRFDAGCDILCDELL